MLTPLQKTASVGCVTFHGTNHFFQRLSDRDMSFEACKEAVRHPDHHQVTPGKSLHGGKMKIFKKRIDGKTVTVVAEVKRNDVWLVTAYFE